MLVVRWGVLLLAAGILLQATGYAEVVEANWMRVDD